MSVHDRSGITKLSSVHRRLSDGLRILACVWTASQRRTTHTLQRLLKASDARIRQQYSPRSITCRPQRRHCKFPQLQRRKQSLPEMFSIPTFPFSQRVRQRPGDDSTDLKNLRTDQQSQGRPGGSFVGECSFWNSWWSASDSKSAKNCLRRELTSLYHFSGFRLRSTAIAT